MKRIIRYGLYWIYFYNCVTVSPSYTITILSGNEEDRFTVKENTTAVVDASKAKPPPRVFKNITLHDEVIILCTDEGKTSTSKIDKTVSEPQIFKSITTDTALIVLKNNLDFESTQDYQLKLQIEDTVNKLIGNVNVKVIRCYKF